MEKIYNVKIIVATHKKYEMPKDEIYFPLQVGAECNKSIDLGICKDNTGDNISYKNACFGTQTALYWAWKNLKADYIGLVHYRRHFLEKKVKDGKIIDSVITGKTLYSMLDEYKVFVPKKRHYYIENVYNHYSNTMNGGAEQLQILREIILENNPEYLNSFDFFMKKRSAYIFNMMILEKSLFNDYCSWLFPILFELEKRVDTSNYSDFDKRYMGRISERMFNVWLNKKISDGVIKREDIKELPYNEDVNWKRKINGFLRAKFMKEKYKKSF